MFSGDGVKCVMIRKGNEINRVTARLLVSHVLGRARIRVQETQKFADV